MQTPPTRPIYWLGNIYIGKIFYQQCFGTSFPSQSATKQICIVKKLQIILSPVQASHNIIDTDMINWKRIKNVFLKSFLLFFNFIMVWLVIMVSNGSTSTFERGGGRNLILRSWGGPVGGIGWLALFWDLK